MIPRASPQSCVVIPSYNAEATIAPLVRQARGLGLDVVVINDGSTDQTARLAIDAGATVISHLHNRGKGAALRTGFAFAVHGGYDPIITLDSDGQHDPSEIPAFLSALHHSDAGMVVGHRLGRPETMPRIRRWTNGVMSAIVSALARQAIPDSQCGFRVIRRALLQAVRLSACRFELETELILKARRARWSVASLPVRSIYHHHHSHIHPLVDGWRFLRLIFTFMVSV
ncbi:MAG: glycosyltransferase family 2 protein [Candidatus Omnitrophica bacterium]|nr:glycosyltransferase family 2 protein [Candidatus Omnitrophota bacterium]